LTSRRVIRWIIASLTIASLLAAVSSIQEKVPGVGMIVSA
jgi:hypothetical protein